MKSACIVLPTYNGEKFLHQQLDSILSQHLPAEWQLYLVISDDGSVDNTTKIIQKYLNSYPEMVEFISFQDKRIGPRRIFEKLGEYCQHLNPDLLLFSDQDDVWLPNKVNRVIELIGDSASPTLYLGSAITTDVELKPIGKIPKHDLKPSFPSILLSNQRAGMAMALNSSAQKEWLKNVPNEAAMHDWWIQQLLLVKKARIVTDQDPFVYYRQHGGNVLGIPNSLRSKFAFLKNQGSQMFILRSHQSAALLNVTNDDPIKRSANLVAKLLGKDFQSVICLIKILCNNAFFSNRIGIDKLISRAMLVYSFIHYRFKGSVNK